MAGDYGFKVSQLGYDVQNAADYNLLASSGWPNLKIEKTGTATLAGFQTTTKLCDHSLGYPPLVILFNTDSNGTYYHDAASALSITSSDVKYDNSGSNLALNLRYYVCRLPLNKNLTTENFKLSEVSKGAKDKDYGIKVLKQGKKDTSKDLRDYNLHSGTRSPMVHRVTYGQMTLNRSDSSNYYWRVTYTNDLGYVPIFLGFYSADGQTWRPLDGYEQAPPKLYVNSLGTTYIEAVTQISGGASTPYGSIVIFKDPYQVSDTQTVTI